MRHELTFPASGDVNLLIGWQRAFQGTHMEVSPLMNSALLKKNLDESGDSHDSHAPLAQRLLRRSFRGILAAADFVGGREIGWDRRGDMTRGGPFGAALKRGDEANAFH